MNDLHTDLDRALRTLPVGEAPVERTRQAGHRLRFRRRAAVVAGALAVIAVAAGYPALSGVPKTAPVTPAAPQRLTAGTAPDTTQGPDGLQGKLGVLAQGQIGSRYWQTDLTRTGRGTVDARFCSSAKAAPTDSECIPFSDIPDGAPAGTDPASFEATGAVGSTYFILARVAKDVPYFIVSFSDGQQLKLIPLTVNGQRYISWAAPESTTVTSVTAHLGTPYNDDGQTATATPFEQPGRAPVFGLWLKEGEAAPARGAKQIGAGPTNGQQWSATAYVGPWGTCLDFSLGQDCLPSASFTTTTILGWVGNETAGIMFGSAAADVTAIRVFLSDGSQQEVKVTQVGGERLFALWTKKGADSVGWITYAASGAVTGRNGTAPAGVSTCPESAQSCLA